MIKMPAEEGVKQGQDQENDLRKIQRGKGRYHAPKTPFYWVYRSVPARLESMTVLFILFWSNKITQFSPMLKNGFLKKKPLVRGIVFVCVYVCAVVRSFLILFSIKLKSNRCHGCIM